MDSIIFTPFWYIIGSILFLLGIGSGIYFLIVPGTEEQ